MKKLITEIGRAIYVGIYSIFMIGIIALIFKNQTIVPHGIMVFVGGFIVGILYMVILGAFNEKN